MTAPRLAINLAKIHENAKTLVISAMADARKQVGRGLLIVIVSDNFVE